MVPGAPLTGFRLRPNRQLLSIEIIINKTLKMTFQPSRTHYLRRNIYC